MNATPKTIQIFLPGGDARGIRVAEITTRIIQIVDVPRSLLGDFVRMPESEHVAVYFLIADGSDGTAPRVYVGQTGDLRARLAEHNQKKDFWQRALVLVSRTHSLTQTHGLFLEWHAIQEVRRAGRYRDENGNRGSRPHTPPPLQADCVEMYETARVLLATLGHPMFEPVVATTASNEAAEVFYCTAGGVDGRGMYTPEGFVVLRGSVGRRENKPSMVGTSDERFRQRLIDDGVMRTEGDTVVFRRDHLFGSPSMAGIALLGRSSNGWQEWKTKDGITLHKAKRDPSPSAAD